MVGPPAVKGTEIDTKKEKLLRAAVAADKRLSQRQLAERAGIEPATAQHHIDNNLEPIGMLEVEKAGDYRNSTKLIESTEFAEEWLEEHRDELEKPATVDEALAEFMELKEEIQDLQVLFEQHRDEAEDARRYAQLAGEIFSDIEADVDRHDRVTTYNEGRIENLEEKHSELEAQLTTLKNRIEEVEEEVDICRTVSENAKNEVSGYANRLRDVADTVKKLETRLDEGVSREQLARQDLEERVDDLETHQSQEPAFQDRGLLGRLRWLVLGT